MPETLKTYSIEKSELLFMFPQSNRTDSRVRPILSLFYPSFMI